MQTTLIGPAEAARLLGVSHRTLSRYVGAGRLPAVRCRRNLFRLVKADVEALASAVPKNSLTAKQARQLARRLGHDREAETVRRALRNGRLAGVRVGHEWRIMPDAVREWIEAGGLSSPIPSNA